jgi:hypothetical protein
VATVAVKDELVQVRAEVLFAEFVEDAEPPPLGVREHPVDSMA